METDNKFLVSVRVDGAIVILKPPVMPLSHEDALLLAAWLVALAGYEEFAPVLEAVLNT